MIRNIIFDIGNVLTDYRWKEFLEEKGYQGELLERIAQASVLSPLWNEYDRGEWTDEQILQAFVDRDPQIEEELRHAFADFNNLVTKRDYAILWIQELKNEGFHVYYLSNFSRKAYDECQDSLDFIPFMDGGILSYQDHVIKPDPAIYRLLMERYHLKPEECVFLDDVLHNVEGARAEGMYAIQFLNLEQARAELNRIMESIS